MASPQQLRKLKLQLNIADRAPHYVPFWLPVNSIDTIAVLALDWDSLRRALPVSSEKKPSDTSNEKPSNRIFSCNASRDACTDRWQDMRIVVGRNNRSDVCQPGVRVSKANVVMEVRNYDGQFCTIFKRLKYPNLFASCSRHA